MEIQNYPNYLIYEDGRVQKIKGQKQGFRKLTKTKDGYIRIGLRNENGEKKFRVHRLVAIHYIPNPNNYSEVDHIDRNPLNNHYTNLRWANRSIQNLNKNIYKNNKSGFKNISYDKHGNRWRFIDLKTKIRKQSTNKIDMICYKFIHTLRIKAKHF